MAVYFISSPFERWSKSWQVSLYHISAIWKKKKKNWLYSLLIFFSGIGGMSIFSAKINNPTSFTHIKKEVFLMLKRKKAVLKCISVLSQCFRNVSRYFIRIFFFRRTRKDWKEQKICECWCWYVWVTTFPNRKLEISLRLQFLSFWWVMEFQSLLLAINDFNVEKNLPLTRTTPQTACARVRDVLGNVKQVFKSK